jgi:hypothetical protein
MHDFAVSLKLCGFNYQAKTRGKGWWYEFQSRTGNGEIAYNAWDRRPTWPIYPRM